MTIELGKELIIILNSPIEATKTAPNPAPRTPPMFRNFSLGAHTATVDRPVWREYEMGG